VSYGIGNDDRSRDAVEDDNSMGAIADDNMGATVLGIMIVVGKL
jgi:hypothetical protein